jgi:TPR repeat protein
MVAPKPNARVQSARKQLKITALLTPALKTARTERVAPIRPPQRANSDERTVVAGLPAAPSIDRRALAGRADQEVGGILELRRRARAGDASARHELARRLIQGDGVEQNFSEGADWFREAAIQGVANAQYNLGVLYERGLGVTRNDVRALLWYHSAAEQSHPLAQYNLGNFYLQGRGIPLSYAEAARWFKAASDQGVAKATYNLGVLTEDGLGVPPDLAKALGLYEKAAASGHQDSASRLAVLRNPGGKELKPAAFANTADTQARGATIGSTVADIQAILQRQGIYVGRIDGIAGPGTRTAIRAFQQLHALPVTGIPSEFLLDYMKISEGTGAKPAAG